MKSLSPSSSYRWIPCPGSVTLCEDEPYTTSDAAELGKGVAALIEFCVNTNRRSVPTSYLGLNFVYNDNDEPKMLAVTREVIDNVDLFLAEVYKHYVRLFSKSTSLHAEYPIDLTHVHQMMKGRTRKFRADVVLFGQNEIVVFDYKNGYVPVFHSIEEPHAQMMCYAEGLRHESLGLVDRITTVVVQPRSSEVPAVQEVHHYPWSIKNWAERTLKPAAKDALELLDIDTDLHAGKHCRFCPAIAKCPEMRAEASRQSSSDFAKYAETSLGPKSPEYFTDAAISRVLTWLPVFNHWAKEVQAYAERKALCGTKLEGFKLVRGKSSRSWPEDVFNQFRAANVEPLMTPSVILSPHQMEENGVDEALIDAIAVKTAGTKLTLVPITDKRPEARLTNGFEGYAVTTT